MVIKVISLNLWWGGHLFPSILEFLKTQDADILMLQEVNNGHGKDLADKYKSMDVLRAKLDYTHEDFVKAYVVNQPPEPLPTGNAVLSKFPIKNKTVHFLYEYSDRIYDDVREQWPIYPRPLQHVELDTPAGPVNVFNMHGIWDLEGDRYSPERQKMGRIIFAATADRPNVILGGDSNATSDNQLIRELGEKFKNSFNQTLKSTFNMRRKQNPGYATAVVDVMFVSPEITVLSSRCPDVDISDHLPIVVKLQIN